MNDKILVTGVTGNIGREVANYLVINGAKVKGTTRNIEACKEKVTKGVELVEFDFMKEETFDKALEDVCKVFLVRPTHLPNPKEDLEPFISKLKKAGVRHIVFISFIGANKNPLTSHFKIERAIKKVKIPYTFLRPGYFMQNLNTLHVKEIIENNKIMIPVGKAKLNFVDTRDIGMAAAKILLSEQGYFYKSYLLTGARATDISTVAEIMEKELNRKIEYANPKTGEFKELMMNRGENKDFIDSLSYIYTAMKFGLAKKVTGDLRIILQREPLSLEEYIRDYKSSWIQT